MKRALYVLLTLVVAVTASLAGAAAGGVAVYQAVQNRSSLPTSIQQVIPAGNASPNQTVTLDTTDIERSIIQSVQKVGPAVVTVVGTVPGQITIFGTTGEQTVSGTGFFITDQGYILTNNHVVEGTKEVNIVLPDGTRQKATIVGTDKYSDIAVLKTDGKIPAVVTLGNSDKMDPGESVIAIGCPAALAGLQENDIITRIDDITIDETHSYINSLFNYQPGDTIDLTVVRDGKEIQLQITLGEAKH